MHSAHALDSEPQNLAHLWMAMHSTPVENAGRYSETFDFDSQVDEIIMTDGNAQKLTSLLGLPYKIGARAARQTHRLALRYITFDHHSFVEHLVCFRHASCHRISLLDGTKSPFSESLCLRSCDRALFSIFDEDLSFCIF